MSIAAVIHCDPKTEEASLTKLILLINSEHIETLSAPFISSCFISSIDLIPPPTVKGIEENLA